MATAGLALAVTALWRPGTFSADALGHRLALNLPNWLWAILTAAAVAMFLAILSVLIPSPRRKDPDEFILEPPPPLRLSPAMLLALLLLLAAMVAGVVALLHFIDPGLFTGMHFGAGKARLRDDASPPIGGHAPERAIVQAPVLDLGLTLGFGAVAVVVISFAFLVIAGNESWSTIAEWFRIPRRRRRPALVRDLVSAMSAGIRELDSGDDPRSAIIACYRRCEALLTTRQRRRYASETPREYVRGALAALSLPAAAVHSLLTVFERARFSDLPVTQGDRSTALNALSEIRSMLEQRGEDGSRT